MAALATRQRRLKKKRPVCIGCRFDNKGFPCRRGDGSVDFAKIATAIVARGRLFANDMQPDDAAFAPSDWASDCEYEIEYECPHLMVAYAVAAMDACETVRDAAFIAAGPIETAIVRHGLMTIDAFEALAKKSAKVRYFLSAIWGEGRTDPAVWARVVAAIGHSGRMDSDGRTPWDGGPVTVLDEAAANTLLGSERVEPIARSLGLVT